MTDYRAELQRLLEAIENDVIDTNDGPRFRAAVSRARTALAQLGPEVSPWPVPGDAEGLAEVFWGRYEQPEPQGPTDEQWDAIKDRLWDSYDTLGYQGECFMYKGDFDTALDAARQELTRFARPTIEPVPGAEVG